MSQRHLKPNCDLPPKPALLHQPPSPRALAPFVQLLKATAPASMLIFPSLSFHIQPICKPHWLRLQNRSLSQPLAPPRARPASMPSSPGEFSRLPDLLLTVCSQHNSQRRSVKTRPGHPHSLSASSGFPGHSEQKPTSCSCHPPPGSPHASHAASSTLGSFHLKTFEIKGLSQLCVVRRCIPST